MEKNKIILTTLSPKTHRTSEENLGIEYLKAVLLKKGYEVIIIDAWLRELEVEEVYNMITKIDDILFVGISSYMSNTAPTVELMNMLKKHDSNIKIACGGFGPTFYPEDYLRHGADYIMRGEGEKAICELADCIKAGKEPTDVKNVGYIDLNDKLVLNKMECLNDDLDSLPFPSRDTMDIVLEKKSTVNMVTARGCSGNCEFCSVISFFRLSDGKVWRTRSINNIVDEIEMLYNKGVKYIKMVDDSFVDGIRDENWCEKFADEINKRGINVKLRGQIRADKVTDKILFDLKRAGFFSFACGIENGSQTALSRMNKKATIEDNRNALELFKKYDYIVQMGYILFDKETTYTELRENYDFMSKYNFALTKGIFSEMFSAEGTPLNARLRKSNALKESDFISNNNKYTIDDELVSKIYVALKLWHKSHSNVYDMTIDPLTAPKAIKDDEIAEFYRYAMELKRLDLKLFDQVLNDMYKYPDIDVIEYIKYYIDKSKEEYATVDEKVKTLYKKSNLIYNACVNPFI